MSAVVEDHGVVREQFKPTRVAGGGDPRGDHVGRDPEPQRGLAGDAGVLDLVRTAKRRRKVDSAVGEAFVDPIECTRFGRLDEDRRYPDLFGAFADRLFRVGGLGRGDHKARFARRLDDLALGAGDLFDRVAEVVDVVEVDLGQDRRDV